MLTANGYIYPRTLAHSYDLVFITYETLRREVLHPEDIFDTSNKYAFRQPKRFAALPSPLLNVEWWRVRPYRLI